LSAAGKEAATGRESGMSIVTILVVILLVLLVLWLFRRVA
jgi:LPXTG-motif cell wall-anchored protein